MPLSASRLSLRLRRRYLVVCADGSAWTYDGALLRLACVPYDLSSTDRRVHITNKWVQTGWEAGNELCDLDDIERLASAWPPYQALLTRRIVPLMQDLADAVVPLLASGLRAQRPPPKLPAGAPKPAGPAAVPSVSPCHFELMACDLVMTADGDVHLMEVNINPAFGSFHERTEATLIRPLFEDLVRLCVLPAAGSTAASGSSGDAGGSGSSGSSSRSLIAPPPYPGRFVRVREAGGLNEALAAGSTDTASDELQAHLAYVTFKKSGRKKYERKAGAVQERDTAVTK